MIELASGQCALARVSYGASTRAKAQRSDPNNGPVLRRRLAPFCSGIDNHVRLLRVADFKVVGSRWFPALLDGIVWTNG